MAWSSRCKLMNPPSTFSRMVVAGHTNARSTFSWLFADVSIYSISQSRASFRASSRDTIRSCTRSHLLPTNTNITSRLLLFFTSYTHRATFRNVSFRVVSNTTKAAAEERQYERVIALNYYWPAVSQICNFITLPFSITLRQANYTPTVYSWCSSKRFYTKRPIMLVLPTAVSPTRMNLNEYSYRLFRSIYYTHTIPQSVPKFCPLSLEYHQQHTNNSSAEGQIATDN